MIGADTTIDGGGLITISGGNSVGIFRVDADVEFTLRNLTIANGAADRAAPSSTPLVSCNANPIPDGPLSNLSK